MNRGIVPTAKPKTAGSKPAAAPKVPPPVAFEPAQFLASMNASPANWAQLPIAMKISRVMAYLPHVQDSNAIASTIAAVDAYVTRALSPRSPLLKGPPVGSAQPKMASPMQPTNPTNVDPRQGFVTDTPQPPIAPPPVPMPKPLVVFDHKSGKMVMPSGQAAQANAYSFSDLLIAFAIGAGTGWFFFGGD